MIWIIITIILSILLVIAIVIISNLYNQVKTLEVGVLGHNNIIDGVFNVHNFYLGVLSKTLIELNRIDKLGAFESDDEVGYIFNTIKELIEHAKFQIEQVKIGDLEVEEK